MSLQRLAPNQYLRLGGAVDSLERQPVENTVTITTTDSVEGSWGQKVEVAKAIKAFAASRQGQESCQDAARDQR